MNDAIPMNEPTSVGELQALLSVVGRWWQDPTITGLNRLPAHTIFDHYQTEDEASGETPPPWKQDLAGSWDFQLLPKPEAASPGWTTSEGWSGSQILVPGNWTMQDTGDKPHYTNVVMPFSDEPPSVPLSNPTGLFRKRFSRRRGWAKRQTILRVGGADSTAAVWCNGTFVGLTTDSRLPSEFDISGVLRAGTNVLAIMVVRWSAGVWIEDQDHWHQAGLHRDIELQSRPLVHLEDIRVTADLDVETRVGRLDVRALISTVPDHRTQRTTPLDPGWSISTSIEHLNGRRAGGPAQTGLVSTFDSTSHGRAMTDAYRHPGPVATTQTELAKVRAWSDEDPYRYRVLVSLVDPSGAVQQVVPVLTGFRNVTISGPELLLNGKAQLLAGVNRHDHHPQNGKTLTAQENLDDVRQIKASGFNALRTAHYPPDRALLDACDEVGLWVVCEANVESHARWNEICQDQRFEQPMVERTQRMVRYHYNHPSIIGWSLGNEAGIGPAHDAAAAWVRSFDPSRFVQYEGGVMHRWLLHAPASTETMSQPLASTDIECPMYPGIEALKHWGAEVAGGQHAKPLIMCEYSHAMGNSNGGLRDYWNLIRTTKGLQGGFIWDWRDQGLELESPDGKTYFGYGGAFGEEPHDAAFCCNGIVGSDAAPHPALEEHRWLTQPVETVMKLRPTKVNDTTASGGVLALAITNRRSFTNLSDLKLTIGASRNGEAIWTRTVATPKVDPQATTTTLINLPKRIRQGARNDEILITACWTLRTPTDWAEHGHEVAWNQARITVARPYVLTTVTNTATTAATSGAESASVEVQVVPLVMSKSEAELATHSKDQPATVVVARNAELTVRVDSTTGDIIGISGNTAPESNLLMQGPRLALWRAPIDNDGVLVGPGAGLIGITKQWLKWGLDRLSLTSSTVNVSHSKAQAVLTIDRLLQTGGGHDIDHRQIITLKRSGPVHFAESVSIPDELSDLPRVGIALGLSANLNNLRWLGLGPIETYPDRSAARRGVWTSTVAEQYVPYATPQHHGSHIETDWFELSMANVGNRSGEKSTRQSVRMGIEGQIFDASIYGVDQLTAANTTDQLTDSGAINVHIDHRLRGVGTGACGPDTTERVGPGTYTFEWSLGLGTR